MSKILMFRTIWNNTGLAIPGLSHLFHELHVRPEPEHPFGRKGLAFAAAWTAWTTRGVPDAAGMLVMDGDVAADPADIKAMCVAINTSPGTVHVAPLRLWPASTRLSANPADGWVWAHGRGKFTQDDVDDPDIFTFSLTYLPRVLIEDCIRHGLPKWAFPNDDGQVCARSRALRLRVNVVREARPCHLHY